MTLPQIQDLGFLVDARRSNVGPNIRAKHGLFIFGNPNTLLIDPFWLRIIHFCQHFGLLLSDINLHADKYPQPKWDMNGHLLLNQTDNPDLSAVGFNQMTWPDDLDASASTAPLLQPNTTLG